MFSEVGEAQPPRKACSANGYTLYEGSRLTVRLQKTRSAAGAKLDPFRIRYRERSGPKSRLAIQDFFCQMIPKERRHLGVDP